MTTYYLWQVITEFNSARKSYRIPDYDSFLLISELQYKILICAQIIKSGWRQFQSVHVNFGVDVIQHRERARPKRQTTVSSNNQYILDDRTQWEDDINSGLYWCLTITQEWITTFVN